VPDRTAIHEKKLPRPIDAGSAAALETVRAKAPGMAKETASVVKFDFERKQLAVGSKQGAEREGAETGE
jgi:hypothetical protein